ncbi:nuclear transport factor 2 family protein [Lentzea kentuckyensis]|uniref:nuclear transport factor 2 family protein n=1 Tax=Lentzea kentuckyensis TaxID=360086 RepID=UPI000A3B2039|nr:nuclear transport factor 2 family protein [Lentzea kentuckyensis]
MPETVVETEADRVRVIEKHVEAYNSHDLKTITSLYVEDISVMDGEEERVKGIEDLTNLVFKHQFEANCRVEILHRIAQGEWVIDHQSMYGTARGDDARLVVGYRVRNGVIDLAVYLA